MVIFHSFLYVYQRVQPQKKTSHNSQRWFLFGPAADRLTKPAGRSCCSCQHCLEGWRRLVPAAPGRGIWRQYQLIIIQYHLGKLPSGKHTKNYGKSPFLMGNSTINGHFQ